MPGVPVAAVRGLVKSQGMGYTGEGTGKKLRRIVMSHTLTIAYEDDVLLSTGMTHKEFSSKAKFLIAANLFMDGKLTAGQAAKFCGLAKVEFIHELPRHGYPMSNLGPEELDSEMELARGENARGK